MSAWDITTFCAPSGEVRVRHYIDRGGYTTAYYTRMPEAPEWRDQEAYELWVDAVELAAVAAYENGLPPVFPEEVLS